MKVAVRQGDCAKQGGNMCKVFFSKVFLILVATVGLSGTSRAESASGKVPVKPSPGGDTNRLKPVLQPTIVDGPYYGGWGGDLSEQRCRHPYGVRLDSSSGGVYRFGLRCTNDTGTVYWDLPTVGRPGVPLAKMECDDGLEIAGFQGRYGSMIDAIGLICRPVDNVRRVLQDTTRIDGGPGGADFVWECPQSFHLVGVRLRSGLQLDGLQPLCEHD